MASSLSANIFFKENKKTKTKTTTLKEKKIIKISNQINSGALLVV